MNKANEAPDIKISSDETFLEDISNDQFKKYMIALQFHYLLLCYRL